LNNFHIFNSIFCFTHYYVLFYMHYYVTPYLKNIAENKAITELLI
jgi:hypothetical protein